MSVIGHVLKLGGMNFVLSADESKIYQNLFNNVQKASSDFNGTTFQNTALFVKDMFQIVAESSIAGGKIGAIAAGPQGAAVGAAIGVVTGVQLTAEEIKMCVSDILKIYNGKMPDKIDNNFVNALANSFHRRSIADVLVKYKNYQTAHDAFMTGMKDIIKLRAIEYTGKANGFDNLISKDAFGEGMLPVARIAKGGTFSQDGFIINRGAGGTPVNQPVIWKIEQDSTNQNLGSRKNWNIFDLEQKNPENLKTFDKFKNSNMFGSTIKEAFVKSQKMYKPSFKAYADIGTNHKTNQLSLAGTGVKAITNAAVGKVVPVLPVGDMAAELSGVRDRNPLHNALNNINNGIKNKFANIANNPPTHLIGKTKLTNWVSNHVNDIAKNPDLGQKILNIASKVQGGVKAVAPIISNITNTRSQIPLSASMEYFNEDDIIPFFSAADDDGHKRIQRIPEIKLIREKNRQNDIIGALNFNKDKFGGMPDWLTPKKIPLCPHCHHIMPLYGQFDAIGSNGYPFTRLFVFFCFDCQYPKVIVQKVHDSDVKDKRFVPTIKFTRDDDKNRPFFHSKNMELGRRSRIGGIPDWLQSDNTPECGTCKKSMAFYGQLDSMNIKYCIGDAGLLYIFYCFDCNKAKVICQCC